MTSYCNIILEAIDVLSNDNPSITDTVWMKSGNWTVVEALCIVAKELGATEDEIIRCTHS